LECEEKFCDQCFDKNHISLKKKNHKKSDFSIFIPQSCDKHSNKNKDFFCHEDNEIICSACAFSSHQGHKVQLLKDAFFEKQKESIDGLTEEEKFMEDEVKVKSEEIKKISNDFEKQKKIFQQEVDRLDKEKEEKMLKWKEISILKKKVEDALDYSLILKMNEIRNIPSTRISKLISNKHLVDIEIFAKKKNLRSLLFKASSHGFTYKDVMQYTKNITPTLVIIQVQENGKIFGGFTSCVPWGFPHTISPTGKSGYHFDDKAFVFSIDKDTLRIFPVKDPNHAVYQGQGRGIDFGGGGTICIFHDGHGEKNGWCNTGDDNGYYQKQINDNEPFTNTTLAGLSNFHVSECEIYTIQ
jgi:hypothetical protein